MQVADHKTSLERIKVVEMETRVVLSAEPAQWAPGTGVGGGRWVHGQCHCQNEAEGDQGPG